MKKIDKKKLREKLTQALMAVVAQYGYNYDMHYFSNHR